MRPLELTQYLEIYDTLENRAYLSQLLESGTTVAPVRRQPPSPKFLNRGEFPRRIALEMTSRCNFLCRMCPQQNLTRPRMDMPGTLYRKVIDEIDRYGIEGLWMYHLGESLLHPEFRENVEHISSKKNLGIIWMSTNGRYFTEEYIRLVLRSNITYINFSVHAVTEDTYGTVAPRENFATVQDNLAALYRLKQASGKSGTPFLRCQMIEQETTRHEVDPFIRDHVRRADLVSINMLEYVNLPNNAYGMKQRARRPLTNCLRVTRNDCFICSNGTVTLCDAAYNGEIFLGNVETESLFDIWNGKKRKAIMDLNARGRMSEIPFCCQCTDYDI
ncbi:MAG: radical SAM protein [Verrucomicrobia bacterium]|nr:radical SAM protein [Verrucomicrobiota bacterium]